MENESLIGIGHFRNSIILMEGCYRKWLNLIQLHTNSHTTNWPMNDCVIFKLPEGAHLMLAILWHTACHSSVECCFCDSTVIEVINRIVL